MDVPWIWLPLMLALVAAWQRGRGNWPGWLLACGGTPPIVLFAMVGLRSSSQVLFHSAAPAYFVRFPLIGAALARLAESGGSALRWTAALILYLIPRGNRHRWDGGAVELDALAG
jgi:hypothetical protein